MKEKKNGEAFSQSVEEYLRNLLLDLFLENLLRDWTKAIQKNHRNQMVTLPEYIGKSLHIVIYMNPDIEVYQIKEEKPIGVIMGKGEMELFIFRKSICIDAFRIPNEIEKETIPRHVEEGFIRFFKLTENIDLPDNITDSDDIPPNTKFRFN